MSIAIEAAELMEEYQQAISDKLALTARKYPAEQYRCLARKPLSPEAP